MILLVNGDKLLESDMFTEEQKKFIKEQEIWTDVKDKLPDKSLNQCLCELDGDFIITVPFSKEFGKFNVRDEFTEEFAAQCEIKSAKRWANIQK